MIMCTRHSQESNTGAPEREWREAGYPRSNMATVPQGQGTCTFIGNALLLRIGHFPILCHEMSKPQHKHPKAPGSKWNRCPIQICISNTVEGEG